VDTVGPIVQRVYYSCGALFFVVVIFGNNNMLIFLGFKNKYEERNSKKCFYKTVLVIGD
jgi:hypothetical protein